MSALKNVDSQIPLNASLATVGYYRGHENGDRPGAAPAVRKIVGFNNLPFGSFHPGGANVSLVDGSVHFLDDDIDPVVFVALASRDGDEVGIYPWK